MVTTPPPEGALSRRTLLRLGGGAALALTAALAGCTPTPAPDPTTSERNSMPSANPDHRILLAYFSRPGENYWNGGRRTLDIGNTEVLAGLIGDRLRCDTYRIVAADPYSDRYDPTVQRNVEEQNSDARPVIAGPLPDLDQYDTVLLGSPIWNVQPPMIMATFAESVDLTGKMLRPFVTYAVSGLGSTQSFYRRFDTASELGDGLAVRGEDVRNSDTGAAVDKWLTAADLT